MSMRYVLDEASKKVVGANWLDALFGDHRILRDLVLLDGTTRAPRVRLNDGLLDPLAIRIKWDGSGGGDESGWLERLRASLCAQLGQPSGQIEDGPEEADILTSALRRLAPPAVKLTVNLTALGKDLPLAAACVLLDKLNEHSRSKAPGEPVRVAISGGLLQALVVGHIHNIYDRRLRTPDTAVSVVALNRMNFNDFERFHCGVDCLTYELAKTVSQVPKMVLPPTSGAKDLANEYEDALNRSDILLLGGGARDEESFLGSFLAHHRTKLPNLAVGDLAGHPLTADGAAAEDDMCRTWLAPLKCRPTLPELARMARNRDKTVILLADAIPLRTDDAPSKAPLVLAVLKAGLANYLMLSKHLAREVLRLKWAGKPGRSVNPV